LPCVRIMSIATRKNRSSLGTGLLAIVCLLMYQDCVNKIVGITLTSVDVHQLRDIGNKTDMCLKNYLKTTFAINLVFNYITVSMIGMAFYGLLTRKWGFMVPYILMILVSLLVPLFYEIIMMSKFPCVQRFYRQENGKHFGYDVCKTVYYCCYAMFLLHVAEKMKITNKETGKTVPIVTKV